MKLLSNYNFSPLVAKKKAGVLILKKIAGKNVRCYVHDDMWQEKCARVAPGKPALGN